MLGVALDEQRENDYVETQEGITFIVEEDLIDRFKGFEIDYTTSWFSKGFVVKPSSGPVSSCS